MSTEVQTTTTTESAPTKRKSSKKAPKETSPAKQSKARSKKPAKKAGDKKAQKAKSGTKERADTKKAVVLEMLRRKEGATTSEIAKATNWQNHTIRGFISGTITKKMALTIES